MWRERRHEHDLALADHLLVAPAALDVLEDHVAPEHVEDLVGRVDVEVAPGVRAVDDHRRELRVLPDDLVADGGLEGVAVLVDPVPELARDERLRDRISRRRLAEGVAQLAGEQLDGAARATGELQLPLALGLEPTVTQPLCPRLDRVADGVSLEGIAAHLLGPRHHVGHDADEPAQRGPGLDRVLAARPRIGEGIGDRLHVVQEEALGPLTQLLDPRPAPDLLHGLEEVHDLLGQRRLAHTPASGAQHLDLAVQRRRVVLVQRADDVVGEGLVGIGIELAAGQADDVRRVQPCVLGVDGDEQLDRLPRVERVEEHRRHVEAQLLAGLAERVQREQPVLAVEHAEHAVLLGNLQEPDVVVAADRREGEALLGRDDDRARDGRERPRVLALAVVRHEFVDLPADHGPLVRRLALADPALERIPVDAGARRLGLLALRLVVAVGAAGITEDLELHEAIDVLGRKSGLIELDAELLDAPRRYRDHGYVRVPDRQVPVNRGVFGLSPPVGTGPGGNTTDRRSPEGSMSTFVDTSVASAKHAMVATPWTPSLSRSCTSIATRSAGTSMSWWSRCKPRWRPPKSSAPCGPSLR